MASFSFNVLYVKFGEFKNLTELLTDVFWGSNFSDFRANDAVCVSYSMPLIPLIYIQIHGDLIAKT